MEKEILIIENMSSNTIESEIINFYNDPLYQELSTYYSKKTIFNILKIERNENRHSAFLAWLLDVNESHELREAPLRMLLKFLYLKSEENRYDSCFLSGNYQIENVKVSTEINTKDGRIDVFITFDYRYDSNDNEKKRLYVIIENKMYTKEHGDQTKRYLNWAEEEKGFTKKNIMGVFLSPNKVNECSGDSNYFKFLKIDYQDLLDYVLEPLLLFDMPQESRFIIQDYVINLEQPLEYVSSKNNGKVKANSKDTIDDTILATSKTKRNLFLKLYYRFSSLLDSALIAYALSQNQNNKAKIKRVFGKGRESIGEDTKTLLLDFWNKNPSLFRMIMNAALDRNDADDKYKKAVNDLLGLKESNRDNTKYLVYDKNHNLMNERFGNGKPVSKSIASFYIFKAWVLDSDQNATLDNIRKAFPVAICAEHYNDMYQYLFYKYDKDKIIDSSDETNDNLPKEKIYAEWAFYTGNNAKKYHLDLNDAMNVVCVKKWLKDEFDKLVDHAQKQYKIISVESPVNNKRRAKQ